MRLMREGLVSAVLVAALSGVASADASAESCLVISNARSDGRPITVEVDGYSGYWVLQAQQTFTITSSSGVVRGASYTFRVYDGEEGQGTKGALYDSVTARFTGSSYGTSTNTLLSLITPPTSQDARAAAECRNIGYWLALVH